MKFIPMTLHYLRYSPKKFLDKLERSPFDTFDLYMRHLNRSQFTDADERLVFLLWLPISKEDV